MTEEFDLKTSLEKVLAKWKTWANQSDSSPQASLYSQKSEFVTADGMVAIGASGIWKYMQSLKEKCGAGSQVTCQMSHYTGTEKFGLPGETGQAYLWATFSINGARQTVTGSMAHLFGIDGNGGWTLPLTIQFSEVMAPVTQNLETAPSLTTPTSVSTVAASTTSTSEPETTPETPPSSTEVPGTASKTETSPPPTESGAVSNKG